MRGGGSGVAVGFVMEGRWGAGGGSGVSAGGAGWGVRGMRGRGQRADVARGAARLRRAA